MCVCVRVFKRAFNHFLTEAILFYSKAIQVDILLSPKRKDSRATPARKRSVVRLVCICVVWLLCVSEVNDLLICVLVICFCFRSSSMGVTPVITVEEVLERWAFDKLFKSSILLIYLLLELL